MSLDRCSVCDGWVDTDADEYEARDINIVCQNCLEREFEND